MQQLAESLVALGRLQEAEEAYSQAAAVADQHAADVPRIEENLVLQASAHRNHSDVLRKLERIPEAIEAMRRSRDVVARLATDFPSKPKYQTGAFQRSVALGRLLVKADRLDEAQEAYTAAEAFVEKPKADATARFEQLQELAGMHIDVVGRWNARKETEADPAFQRMLATLHRLEAEYSEENERQYALAEGQATAISLLLAAARFRDAEVWSRRALVHASAAVARAPDESARRLVAESHQLLARCLNQLKRPKEAEAEFRAALPIYEELTREFPRVTRYRGQRTGIHNHLGWLMRSQKDLPAAESEFRRALRLCEQLAEEFPDDAWKQSSRAESLWAIALVRRERGDPAEARTLLEQAMPFAEKACELDSGSQVFRDRLENIRRELAATLKAQKAEKKK